MKEQLERILKKNKQISFGNNYINIIFKGGFLFDNKGRNKWS